MRLKQIKLAGFKSFVDPTSFEVPSQLVGVVGPNGCGKSNIMDAVRWVLGESKASELRGDSMQDVIFNGSDQRKPAGRASVELVFDNSLGRIGGSWGQFGELAVKRVLTRDGQSSYYINNQPVRRRDVHDIFLGTGLGPRAYAIIGQGTVSRIIEARPEDLRVFLEEAAGVSKYKERRRETEHRLADTRDNLVRVEDILRELAATIDKLERQAEVAARFRDMEAERVGRQQLLWMVRRDDAVAEAERIGRTVERARTELEFRVAEQRAVEAELEALRAARDEAADAMHAAQGAWYEANSEVAAIEQRLRFAREAREQLVRQAESARAQRAQAGEQGQRAAAEIDVARHAAEEAGAAEEMLGQAAAEQAERLPLAQDAVARALAALEAARNEAQASRSAIEVAGARQRAASDALRVAASRRDRLMAERAQLRAPADDEVDAARERLAQAEHEEHHLSGALVEAEALLSQAEADRPAAQEALRQAQARSTQVEARIAALRQLQERVQSRDKVGPWLSRHGLEGLSRLWQRMRIEPGWETAIESVLRERVAALEAGQVERFAGLLDDAPPGRVAFYAPSATIAPPSPAPAGMVPLARMVHCADAGVAAQVADWLHGCFAAESAEHALARRPELPPGGAFVLRAGHAVRRGALQFHAPDGEQDGLLARQQELDNLTREQRAQQLLAEDARMAAQRVEAQLAERQASVRDLRDRLGRAVRQLASQRVELERLEQATRAAGASRERILAELEEVAAQAEEQERVLAEEADAFERHDAELAERQERMETLRDQADDAQRLLAQARDEERRLERDAREASFRRREAVSRIEQLERTLSLAGEQAAAATERLADVESRLAELDDGEARAALEAALAERIERERRLAEVRARHDDLAQRIHAAEDARLGTEREQAPLRERIGQLQLDEQAQRLTASQFQEQLTEAGADEAAVLAALGGAEPPRPSWLQGEVTRLSNAIAALGPVNLAALDELKEAAERKGFLDAQNADLNEAIATLEDAIRRIDRETRALLQETFDTVNREFGRLFPQLFAGGEARLILTGEEILDSGVTVMAQPPGKRNSTIHLLSGGEKALTAIALVFAMFQLNPAPFCLLDEVDAPLDDANTERYANLVRAMSEQTQFLFITHNKIAMELAQQLIGVTMQEKGVSRIVAVDLESAGRLAEAA